jgi:plasmid stability protein
MPTNLTLKNVPDDVYRRLREVAGQHRRSLNNEAIACLEQVLMPARLSVAESLAAAREIRERLDPRDFDADEIARLKDTGRP